MDLNKILKQNKNDDRYKLLLDEFDYKYHTKHDINLVIEKLEKDAI